MLVTLTPAAQFRFLLLLPPFGSYWWGTVTVSNSVPLGLVLCYQNDQFPALLAFQTMQKVGHHLLAVIHLMNAQTMQDVLEVHLPPSSNASENWMSICLDLWEDCPVLEAYTSSTGRKVNCVVHS